MHARPAQHVHSRFAPSTSPQQTIRTRTLTVAADSPRNLTVSSKSTLAPFMMSSALPADGAVRYNQNHSAGLLQTPDGGDSAHGYGPQPPAARPISETSVKAWQSEYDPTVVTESLVVQGGPLASSGAFEATGPEAALAAASEWVEVEDAKDGKIDSDSAILDENRPCKTSVDPYEMLLMPGAGLHRSLLDPEGPGSPKKYGITQNMAHLGSPSAGKSIEQLYDQALSEGGETMPLKEKALEAPSEQEMHLNQGLQKLVPEVDVVEEVEEENLDPLTLKQVVTFALPAMGAVLADPLMSLVDTACVGQMSSIGLAALGPNTTIFGFVGMMFQFLTTATTAMVARAYMKSEKKEMGKAVSDGLLIACISGVAACAVLLTCTTPILSLLNTGSEIMAPAAEYLFWRALALPFTLVSMVGAACCLGQRDPATPLRVAGLSGLVNLVVDMFLVLGPPAMGIKGAAIATAGSQMMAAALYVWVISKRLTIKFRLPYWARVKPFVTAGAVLTLRSICIMTSLSMMTSQAAILGTTSIATHQVVVGLLTLAQFCPEPISQAAQTFLASTATALRKGQCTPKEMTFAKDAGRLLMKCGVAFGVFLAVSSAGIATHLPHLFTSDPTVMASVASVAPQLGIAVLLYTFVCTLDGLVFASGDMMFAAAVQVVNLASMVGLLALFGGSLPGIWTAFVALCGLRFVENASRVVRHYI
mmetsp:Transcript_50339/g.96136  ORF Transcript_50339/g.96136 Transcript_50339/m.96136 type:complete len:704 (+) Transcript_50339:89-2200(+)